MCERSIGQAPARVQNINKLFRFAEDTMKAYIITTGTIFGLITLAHILRISLEDRRLATDPFFLLLTMLAAALSFWAWRLIRNGSGAKR